MNVRMMLLILILSISILGCSMSKIKTAEFVTLLEISEDSIVIKNQSNETLTVKVPTIITKLLEINDEYFVEYEFYKNETPTLVSIEPVENNKKEH